MRASMGSWLRTASRLRGASSRARTWATYTASTCPTTIRTTCRYQTSWALASEADLVAGLQQHAPEAAERLQAGTEPVLQRRPRRRGRQPVERQRAERQDHERHRVPAGAGQPQQPDRPRPQGHLAAGRHAEAGRAVHALGRPRSAVRPAALARPRVHGADLDGGEGADEAEEHGEDLAVGEPGVAS